MSSRRTRAVTVVPAARGEAPEAISVLTLDLGLRALQNLGLGNQDQVETGQRLEPAEALAQTALGPLRGRRAADLGRRREAQPAVRASVRRRHHQEKAPVEANSLPKRLPELRPPDHPLRAAQPPPAPPARRAPPARGREPPLAVRPRSASAPSDAVSSRRGGRPWCASA